MNVLFYGGRQAGLVCLLSLMSRGDKILAVIPQDELVENAAKLFNLRIFKPKDSINSKESENFMAKLKPDILVCVHGRQIIKSSILSIPKKGAINVHPCLYKYKGANPIERLLADKETKASVGVHKMVEKIDSGEVIEEIFIDTSDCKTVIEV